VAGFDVVLAGTTPLERLEGFDDLRVYPLGARFSPTRPRPVFLIRRALNQAAKFRRLRRLIREFRPHIVHVNGPTGKLDFLYFRYLRALGARVVYTAHEPEPDTGVDWFDRARCRSADAIFVHSQKSLEAIARGGIPHTKIARIYHGAYLDICPNPALSRDEAKRSLGIGPHARVVLFFGAIQPYKGLDILLKAFARVTGEDPDTRLIIAGEPQEDFAPYRHEIDALGLTDRTMLDLRYIPFAEFPRYFCAADVVALPYRRVQQSGALQLAYAYSRPVVATNVGGLYEAVKEDGTGIIVDAGDEDQLASGIRQMLSDPAAGDEMGRRGRHAAETKYSWNAIVERIAQVYRAIHGGTPTQDERLPDLAR
jgi:D-inositol-3-phosphate glycosyltransferase